MILNTHLNLVESNADNLVRWNMFCHNRNTIFRSNSAQFSQLFSALNWVWIVGKIYLWSLAYRFIQEERSIKHVNCIFNVIFGELNKLDFIFKEKWLFKDKINMKSTNHCWRTRRSDMSWLPFWLRLTEIYSSRWLFILFSTLDFYHHKQKHYVNDSAWLGDSEWLSDTGRVDMWKVISLNSLFFFVDKPLEKYVLLCLLGPPWLLFWDVRKVFEHILLQIWKHHVREVIGTSNSCRLCEITKTFDHGDGEERSYAVIFKWKLFFSSMWPFRIEIFL